MADADMTRRDFVKIGGVAAVVSAGGEAAEAAQSAVAGAAVCREPARDVPVVEGVDVVVCGAGPAGTAAALAAARGGAKTVLVENHGCLGGIWTAGCLSWLIDYGNKPGIMQEILARLEGRGGRARLESGAPSQACDKEAMKLLLDDLCVEAGVRIYLHTRVVAAVKDGGRLTHVICESKSGRQAMTAKVFIDCTGDGDVGARAGCRFEMGQPGTGNTQPMSLICLLGGIDAKAVRPFYREAGEPWAPAKDRLRALMEKGGHSPSYSKPSIFRVRDGLFIMMANHEYGVKGTNVRDVTEATLRARREVNALIAGLRSMGGPWANVHIVATAEQIGVREGRRVRGLYVVSDDDLRVGARHDDAVCRVTFGIDVHSTDPKAGKAIEEKPFRSKPYDIPLRALIAADVNGLMMAGRCISGDFIAHSSYRVTGNAVAMGEAAGRTAALAATRGCLPQDVPIGDVRGV